MVIREGTSCIMEAKSSMTRGAGDTVVMYGQEGPGDTVVMYGQEVPGDTVVMYGQEVSGDTVVMYGLLTPSVREVGTQQITRKYSPMRPAILMRVTFILDIVYCNVMIKPL